MSNGDRSIGQRRASVLRHAALALCGLALAIRDLLSARSFCAGRRRSALFYGLPALVVLGFAHPAFAATTLPLIAGSLDGADAPMCDPTGASVGARAVIPEVDRGAFEQSPCDALPAVASSHLGGRERTQTASLHGNQPSQQDPALAQRARPEGARALSVAFPARGEPSLVSAPAVVGICSRPGHRLPVYRPPVTG
jgi:hypothetical protein